MLRKIVFAMFISIVAYAMEDAGTLDNNGTSRSNNKSRIRRVLKKRFKQKRNSDGNRKNTYQRRGTHPDKAISIDIESEHQKSNESVLPVEDELCVNWQQIDRYYEVIDESLTFFREKIAQYTHELSNVSSNTSKESDEILDKVNVVSEKIFSDIKECLNLLQSNKELIFGRELLFDHRYIYSDYAESIDELIKQCASERVYLNKNINEKKIEIMKSQLMITSPDMCFNLNDEELIALYDDENYNAFAIGQKNADAKTAAASALQHVKEKHQQIKQITEEVEEVGELVEWQNVLIESQHLQLESIVQSIEKSKNSVQRSNADLQETLQNW